MRGQAAAGGVARHWCGDGDEVRVAAEPCREAGEGGRGRAVLPRRRRVSAHQRHCSSFIYLYSWPLSAPRTEDENGIYRGKQPSCQPVSAGEQHWPRERPCGSSHCRYASPEQPCWGNCGARGKVEMEDSANKTPQTPELRQDCASECLNRELQLAESLCSCPIES